MRVLVVSSPARAYTFLSQVYWQFWDTHVIVGVRECRIFLPSSYEGDLKLLTIMQLLT